MDKLSSQVLQLDEVSFCYVKESLIFDNIWISANMESRICIVSSTSFSLGTGVLSALETFVTFALYKSSFTIPYHTIMSLVGL